MYLIDVHTHKLSTQKKGVSILNTYPYKTNFSTYFSIGIHPWFINKNKISEELLIIENNLQHKNCLAIGECGLDKNIETDLELQKAIFIKHISLSEKYKKPIIIHCVKSFQEIIEIKKELKPKQIWILHGFNKNLQVANSLLKNKIMLSFGSAIINNINLQEVIASISIDKIFLETDDTQFSILEIYKKVASIKQIKVEELQQSIIQNFTDIF